MRTIVQVPRQRLGLLVPAIYRMREICGETVTTIIVPPVWMRPTNPRTANATIYRRNAADRALIDWVIVSAGWTRG
jgi:hypothetical protein